MAGQRPGLLMCVCTGKCPGFEKMDIWDFINRVRVELPVEFGAIHPQLCETDGDRFLADFLQAKRPLVIAACALIFEQCAERDIPADATGCAALLDVVRIYHRIVPEEEAEYRSALLAAYQNFRSGAGPAK